MRTLRAMTQFLRSRATPVAIATGVAGLCVGVAAVVLAIISVGRPPIIESSYGLGHAWFQLVSGAILILLAARLRRREEAISFALLAGACLLAGWAIQEFRYDVVSGRFIPWIDLLAGLALVPAPTAVVAAFASTPPRRLANLAPAVLTVVVGISVVAVVGQSAIREHDASYSGIGQPLVDAFSSSLVTIAVVLIAALGSIRNEAQRFVGTSLAPRRDPAVPRRLGYFLLASLSVGVLVAGAGFQSPGAAQGHTLLPLLAALVAIIGARWSAYISWAALAVSLAIGASVAFSGALDIEIQKIVQDPDAPWVPNALWLLLAGCSLLVAFLGIAAASSAVVEARNAGAERADRAGGNAGKLAAAASGVAAWATAAWLFERDGLEAPLLEGPFWAIYMSIAVLACLLVIAAAEAVRRRLVPAIAEAEATARHPLRPFRYLETVAIETLTARAALRRSATAAERSRLASDLHAQILPSLADIRARYESGAVDADVAVRLRELEREVRDLMAERRLVVLEEFGIVEAIEWLVGRAEERASMAIQLSVDDRSTDLRPPREVERAAFRVAQLAVENVLQHAAPGRLELQVLARADEVRIAVVDDGPGMQSTSSDRERDHVGISDMRSQAAEVHGDVTVVSPASGGTTVTFAWPGGVTAA